MDILETDVLIIGGGFAGCWAALRAADLKATVTLVDKAYVSRSGASTMSGGITTCPLDSDDLDTWAEEFIVRGSYMCDQRWTYQLLEGQRERIKDYVRWNVPISRSRRRIDPPVRQPRHGQCPRHAVPAQGRDARASPPDHGARRAHPGSPVHHRAADRRRRMADAHRHCRRRRLRRLHRTVSSSSKPSGRS